MKMITGYCESLASLTGQTVRFMISAEGVTDAEVQMVRLLHGDENPEGPGFVEEEIEAACNGPIQVHEQFTQAGSYIEVPDPEQRLLPADGFTICTYIWPTTPVGADQAIITQWSEAEHLGYGLFVNAQGHLALRLGDGKTTVEVATDEPLLAKVWYFVAASYDPASGVVSVQQTPIPNAYNSLLSPFIAGSETVTASKTIDITPRHAGRALLFAGCHDRISEREVINHLYNGKIDRAALYSRALNLEELAEIRGDTISVTPDTLANWDTTAGYRDDGIGDTLLDTGPHGFNGIGINRPIRAMTGFNWQGRDDCFRLSPEQFGGIAFHDDAIIDCCWQPTFEWRIPADLKSGVYAARLRAGELEDHVTVFVRPQTPRAKIAILMPTASYLAYANERFVLDSPGVQVLTAHPLVFHDCDYLLAAHPEWGRSSYDHHSDGAGVCYCSYRRPVMALRPKHRMASTGVPWQFPADMSIIYWLEKMQYEYDVITDEDLNREGIDCLRPYNVVLNGTHSEYYSEQMLDASEQYVAEGGRIMYLGGNGYYWVVAFRDDEPWCMEIRKLNAGSRAWQAEPGEYYMATNGEKGGIWRDRGRPPQKIMGVGFTSEGMDESMPYRRMPDSYDESVAWIFAEVEGEVFGKFGLAGGGAAGIELDRYDLSRGTPPNTRLLASSEGHSDNYPHVVEEIMFNYPGLAGTQDFQVRADVTYFETGNGGAVFSTGSIAWGQALPCDDGSNDVSRITANVLNAFMQEGEEISP